MCNEHEDQTPVIDEIIEALSTIVKLMNRGGIDQFDLSIGNKIKFTARRKQHD